MPEYIEREALYKIMENWRDAHADVDDADGCGLLEDVMCEINAQTAADVAPVVHGRWVHPKGYVVSNGFLCSECNHEEPSHYPIHPLRNGGYKADEHGNFFYQPKINYCPHCGARMDGE